MPDSGTPGSLSVIVPVLDEERWLPGLLASLAAGTRVPDEVIVVDGGSRDATTRLAAAAGARVLAAPRGRGAQLGEGARHAAGELLLFLHADMRLAPEALAAVVDAFADEGTIAAGLKQRIDATGRLYRMIEGAANRRVRRGSVYGDSGLAVRRAIYDEVGGFRALPLFEDLDLTRRLRRRGRIAFVDGARFTLSARRWEREGPVRRTVKNWALTLAWRAGVDPARLARYYLPDGSVGRET